MINDIKLHPCKLLAMELPKYLNTWLWHHVMSLDTKSKYSVTINLIVSTTTGECYLSDEELPFVLNSVYTDTRETASNALKAAKAYQDIKMAIIDAYNASRMAVESAEDALGKVNNFLVFYQFSQYMYMY